jgi:hypothetical protein
VETKTAVDSRAVDRLAYEQEEELVLAAAIAALLVEHGHLSQHKGQNAPQNDPTNWQLLARWEQLRG